MNKNIKVQCENGIKKAVKLSGGLAHLAKLIDKKLKAQHIYYWLYIAKRIPAKYVLTIEKILKGKVTRYEMRPDLYPPVGDN